METVTYTAIGSKEQYGELLSLRRNVDRSISADEVQQNTANLLPKYARLTDVSIELRWGCEGTINGNSDLYINGTKIGDTCVGHNDNPTNTRLGLQGYFSSEQQYPGRPNGEIKVHLNGSSRIWYIFHLKVHYTYETPKFVISLSQQGKGTVSGAGTYDIGTNATITATPAKGYKFIKWNDGNTSASRTVTVANGEQAAFSTTLKYKAVFEMDTVLIAYYGNGATSGELGRVLEQKDISCTLKTNWFEKKYAVQLQHNDGTETVETLYSSADFLGWYTSAEGGERVGGSGDPFTPTGSTELYAHWSDMPAVTLPSLTRDRYTFLGWYTAANDGTKIGDAEESYEPTGDITLYAHWGCTVTLIGNGATETPIESIFVGESKNTTLPNNFKKVYYVGFKIQMDLSDYYGEHLAATLLGWYTEADGGTKIGDGGASYTPDGDITLYAHWSDMPAIILPPPPEYSKKYVFAGYWELPNPPSEYNIKYGDEGDNFVPYREIMVCYPVWIPRRQIYIGDKQIEKLFLWNKTVEIYLGTTIVFYNP